MATPANPLPQKALGLVAEAFVDLEAAVARLSPLLDQRDLETIIRVSKAMEHVRRAQLKLKDAQQIGGRRKESSDDEKQR